MISSWLFRIRKKPSIFHRLISYYLLWALILLFLTIPLAYWESLKEEQRNLHLEIGLLADQAISNLKNNFEDEDKADNDFQPFFRLYTTEESGFL